VADVHLRPGERAKEETALRFLREQAAPGNRLFILGDFFDLWVGPRHHGLGEYDDVVEELARLARTGTEVYFLPGNRDFYGAELLAREIGARYIPEPRVFELDGLRVYVAHGDRLCARDLRYRVGRGLVRNRVAEWLFLNFPLELSFYLAHGYRTLSRRLLGHRDSRIVHVLPEVAKAIFASGADVIVAGHVHRAEEQTFTLNGHAHRLFTLGDWSAEASYLELSGRSFTFRTFSAPPASGPAGLAGPGARFGRPAAEGSEDPSLQHPGAHPGSQTSHRGTSR
jgi:UDP-2,3-diacylglucosamine hydrolase